MASIAITLLKDEFAAGDMEAKVRASSRLKLLATVLGPERTASELLPAVTEIIQANREADEILFVISKSLLTMVDLVGKNYTAFCNPLEALSTVEETTVRERAVRGLQEVCSKMTAAQCHHDLFPLMKRLAEAEWFTPRRSACGLLSPIYNKVDASQKNEVLETMNHLVADETPMVRRAVAASLGGMALAPNGSQVAIAHLSPIWMTLTDDPHFSVRVAAVNSTAALVQAMGKDAAMQAVVPHLTTNLVCSRGWRVRNALAGQLGGLSKALPGLSSSQIVPMCAQLCRDFEDEVSENAMNQLVKVAECIKLDEGPQGLKAFGDALIPVLQYVAGVEERRVEASPRMRRAVARCSIGLAEVEPQALGSRLSKIWERFLSDTKSKDAADVSRVMIEGLRNILLSLGAEFSLSDSSKWGRLVKQLYESSKSKAVDEVNAQLLASQNGQMQNQGAMGDALPGDPVETPKWRVRVYIIDNLDALYKADKGQAMALWASALSDEAFEVRVAAGDVLEKLCQSSSAVGGAAGVAKDFCPLMMQFFRKSLETNSYQQRIAAIRCAAVVAKYGPTWAAVQPMFLDALKDPVSNVILSALICANKNPEIARAMKEQISPLLKSSDADVADFAKAALAVA
jgi:hypothetical protein